MGAGTATQAQEDTNTDGKAKRILFIGNSYTGPVRRPLSDILKQTPYSHTVLEFSTKGGLTLQKQLKREEVIQTIKSGKWDYVVLQEQSQTPALRGTEDFFFDAAKELCDLIEDADAKPVFYMTWGRRDGDQQNASESGTFEKMQDNLSDAYRKAARKNKAILAPVGEAWAAVRKENEALGRELYSKDGSHPSKKGAYLTAMVFYRILFDNSMDSFPTQSDISAEDVAVFKKAVSGLDLPRGQKTAL